MFYLPKDLDKVAAIGEAALRADLAGLEPGGAEQFSSLFHPVLLDVLDTFSQFFKQKIISDYLLENSQLQRRQIQKHLGHIPKNYLLSQQFLKVLLQSPITQS